MGDRADRHVRITDELHGDLYDLKKKDETYNDVIRMLYETYVMHHDIAAEKGRE